MSARFLDMSPPDCGKIIADERRWRFQSWWIIIVPGSTALLTLFVFVLGAGIRELYNPRWRDRGVRPCD